MDGSGLRYLTGFLGRLGGVTKIGGRASAKGPDFIVSPGGTAFPIPKGATGPASVVNLRGKTTGSAFTCGRGGENGDVDTIRIMITRLYSVDIFRWYDTQYFQ